MNLKLRAVSSAPTKTRYQRALAEEYLGNTGFKYWLVCLMLEEFEDMIKAKTARKKLVETPRKKSCKTKDTSLWYTDSLVTIYTVTRT